jgi:hypothetical protein
VVTFSITYLKVQVKADTSDILWWLLVASIDAADAAVR